MKKRFIILAIAALSALGCSKEPPRPPEARGVSVVTALVEAREVPDMVQSVGTVESRREAVLSAKVMGAILEFPVEEGQRVGKGEVLLTIDVADIRARKREAEQARAEGEASLKEAKAALENAEVNLGRMQALYDEKAVTRRELDDMSTQRKMASAKVEQVEARIAQAEAGAAQADVLIGYSVIRSPISGVVTAKTANVGEMAAPGRPLIKVQDDGALRLLTSVKESEVAGLRKGGPVKVTVDALSGRELTGRVAEVVPAADPSTRSFSVKVDLPASSGLMPGMFGRAYLPAGKRRAVLLPAGSLVEKEGVQGAYVLTPEGTLRFQAVRLGEETGGLREVLSGLDGGERVAVGDLGSLREGMRAVK